MSLLKYESQLREPLVDGDKNYHQVTEDIIRPDRSKTRQALVDWLFYCNVPVTFWSVFSVQGSNLWYWPMES